MRNSWPLTTINQLLVFLVSLSHFLFLISHFSFPMATTTAIRAGRAFVELFADDSALVRTLRRAENHVKRFGENIKAIGRRLTMFGFAASLPFAAAMKTYAEFDDIMRAVKATTGAVGMEFEMLTEKAKFLGRTTSFTASQIAESMLELGRAGFAPKEIDSSITGILDLARATKTDLAQTTLIASSALRSFNLPAEEMTRICDVMVMSANNSAQTLEDLGLAMAYCAPIAEKYGLSLEQTSKAIGALSNYGIKASQAGTTFRRILVNLADKNIQRRLKGLGVSVQDVKTGKMRDVAAVLKDLGVATQKMAKNKKLTLFKEIFGVWALAGGASLTTAEFDRLYDSIDDAGGIARRTAKEMDLGLAGSLRMLWSAVEAVAIAIGEALNPVLQPLVDWMTRACSGLVVFITNNKQLVVTIVKTIAAITGIGLALVTVGSGFIVLAKTVGIIATSIAKIAGVFLLAFNILQGCLSVVLFTGNAFVSVFTGIAAAISTVAVGIASGFQTAFLVLTRLGSIALAVSGVIIRSMMLLGTSVLGAFGLIGRGVALLVPMVASVLSTSFSLLTGIITGTVSLIASAIMSVLPVLGTGLAAMGAVCSFAWTVIAAGIASAFSSISTVIYFAFLSVGASIVTFLNGLLTTVGSVVASALTPVLTALTGFCTTLVTTFVSMLGSLLTAIGTFISSVVTTMVTWLVVQFASCVGMTAAFLGHLIAAVGAAVAGILASLAPILVVLATIAAAVAAASLLIASFGKIASAIGAIFIKLVRIIGSCLSAVLGTIVALGTPIVGKLIDVFQWIMSGAWGLLGQLGAMLSTAVGQVISTVQNLLSTAWDGVVASFTSAVNLLDEIIASLGTFFLNVFADIGTAVNWLRERFGHLCSFAIETYNAIVTALGNGDIEAAIQVIWASIKLIWVQGSNAILTTWYWLVETLQTAWATCVYKISELLTSAWYGVQQFWTETVYTMATVWAEFSHGVVSAWKKAEESIAQGIGWIIAKMQGLDPNEMANIIAEDYNRQTRERDTQKSQRLNEIQTSRDKRQKILEAEKQGTLDILKSDFEQSAGVRDAAYQAKLAAQQQELDAAKAAYDEAINRVKNPPPALDENAPALGDRLKRQAEELMRGLDFNFGEKVSVTGSFSAAAIASMGATSTMDRVANATEQSEKHLAKIANKEEKAKPAATPKKENQAAEPDDKDAAVAELKIHTRLLRDLSVKGGGVFV